MHWKRKRVQPFGNINLNLCTDIPPWCYSVVDSKGLKEREGKQTVLKF